MRLNQLGKLTSLMAGVALAVGCSTLRVDTEPSGATVLWSNDGERWQSWPPNSWQLRQSGRGNATPFSATGVYGDTVLITVDKDGYRRPLPQVVQLYATRRERLNFELEELPETYAARMEADGFVQYRGGWVRPDDAGLAAYNGRWMPAAEAFRLEQLAKGMVEYNGEWYTPEQAMEQETADRLAAGYLRFKDRWVKPEVKEYEETIDFDVSVVAAEMVYPDLQPPRVLGTVGFSEAQLQLYNSTGQTIRFLFSGPTSRSYTIPPYSGIGMRTENLILLSEGRYDIAVLPSDEDATGQRLAELLSLETREARSLRAEVQFASWPLVAGTQYSFNYTGSDRSLQEALDAFELPESELDIEIPVIEIPELAPPQERRRPGGAGGGGGRPQ